MPNHTRTRPDGTYVDGFAPSVDDWEDLDAKVFDSWNGDRGGAYGGAGYTFAGAGLQVTGPTRLTHGGSIYGGPHSFVIPDGTWPQLVAPHSGRTRSIVQPIHSFSSRRPYLWSRRHKYAGVGSVALACRLTNGSEIEVPEMHVPLRVIDGSVLKKLVVYFRVASPRSYAPIGMPKIRVLRVPHDTGATHGTVLPDVLKNTSDGTGFDSPALLSSGAAWYADGAVQTFEYVCDQNNTIDVENFSYLVHIVEEVGARTPTDPFDGICFVERKADVQYATFSTTQDYSGLDSPAIDGEVAFSGIRMLLVDPDSQLKTGQTTTYSNGNGIYIQDSNPWQRAGDLAGPADFTPNWIVRVLSGKLNGGTTWQCQRPQTGARIKLAAIADPTDQTSTQIAIVPAEPKGNIYHSLVPIFEVSDLRFQ